jgi:hypothetical protein
MKLSKEAFQALEDIVGQDNISDDPALLDTYRYPLSHTTRYIRPGARLSCCRGAPRKSRLSSKYAINTR